MLCSGPGNRPAQCSVGVGWIPHCDGGHEQTVRAAFSFAFLALGADHLMLVDAFLAHAFGSVTLLFKTVLIDGGFHATSPSDSRQAALYTEGNTHTAGSVAGRGSDQAAERRNTQSLRMRPIPLGDRCT